jgi:hypothetical protein
MNNFLSTSRSFHFPYSKLLINVDLTVAMKCHGTDANLSLLKRLSFTVYSKFRYFLDIGADILDLSGATVEGENIKEEAVRLFN